MREILYTQVIIWVNIFLNHMVLILGQFYLSMMVLAWYIDLNAIEKNKNKKKVKYSHPAGIKKMSNFIMDTRAIP